MTPVGFLGTTERRRWYAASGKQSKVFGTIDEFLQYAGDALWNRGKSVVGGLFTHWLLRIQDVERFADVQDGDMSEFWASSKTTARYGTVMILRRLESNKIQMIWFDPYRHNETVQGSYSGWTTHIFQYRERVISAVQAVAGEHGGRFHSRWWGGHTPAGEDDSVSLSFMFLRTVMEGGSLGRLDLPAADDHVSFQQQGFMKTD